MPEMGISRNTVQRPSAPGGLADALFSATQQRVLGLLFGQPDRSFYATELISLTGGGSGAMQRELTKLERSGLLITSRRGTQKHYQANPQSPIFEELCGIARKTVGLAEPLREALAPLAVQIAAAFVYGSIAKRTDTARSDIDLMIVSDTVGYPDVMGALQQATLRLGREINPSIYNRQELEARLRDGNAFVKRVLEQPKVWIIGDDHVLPA
jgi:predicted nucleotidyltransferase